MTSEPSTFQAPSRRVRLFTLAAGVVVLFWCHWIWVSPYNFGGYDEWAIVHLLSRGIINIPHANRPFSLIWHTPGLVVARNSFGGFYFLHGAYMCLSAIALFAICRLAVPSSCMLAFLAAVFSVAWVPLDASRLLSVWGSLYSGLTLGLLLAILLFIESWRRENRWMLIAAMAIAFVEIRAYEGTVPLLLLGAPMVLLQSGPRRPWRRVVGWVGAWEVAVAGALVMVVLPLLPPIDPLGYQSGTLDLDPWRVGQRLLQHFAFQLQPLFTSDRRELAVSGVALTVFVFLLAYRWAARCEDREGFEGSERFPAREAVRLLSLGLLLAGFGFAGFAVSSMVEPPFRTQIFAAPGTALFLASTFLLAARIAPRRFRRPLVALLGAWVVAVGTGRTVTMQAFWDTHSSFPAQRDVLRQLTTVAPDVRSNTFVILIDDARAFPATFSFRAALQYLYEGRAIGCVARGAEGAPFFPTKFGGDGVRSTPWPAFQRSWRELPTFHRYDEILVARYAAPGHLQILEEWPAPPLRPLPPGAAYRPLEVIRQTDHLPLARASIR